MIPVLSTGERLHHSLSVKELGELLTFMGKLGPEALLLRPTGRAGFKDRLPPAWSCPKGLLCVVTNKEPLFLTQESVKQNVGCQVKARLLLKTAPASSKMGGPTEGRAM